MATEKRLISHHKACADCVHTSACFRAFTLLNYPFEQNADICPLYAKSVDAVEVVLCKDCKHCDPENLHCDHPMGTTFPFRRKPDDFCSYGERKDK